MTDIDFKEYDIDKVVNEYFKTIPTTIKEKNEFEKTRKEEYVKNLNLYEDRFKNRPTPIIENAKECANLIYEYWIIGTETKKIHEDIINGLVRFIKDLSVFAKYCGSIDFLKYLSGIINNTKPEPPTNKIKWTGRKIELITIFYDLFETGLIKGNKETINKLIRSYFVDENGKPFLESHIRNILTPSKDKAEYRADFSKLL